MNRLTQACLSIAAAHVTADRIGVRHDVVHQKLSANGSKGIGIEIIDATRKNNSVTVVALCAAAGVGRTTYLRALQDPSKISQTTLARLADALRKLRTGNRLDPSDKLASVAMIYGGFLAQVCAHYGVTPDQVRAADPRAGTTADPTWRATAHARQAAIYLTHVSGGIAQRAIARAVGLTEAAVCLAIQSIEDRRDDPAFDRMIDRAAKAVTGRVT